MFGGKRQSRALLIDGDVWAYQVASACERAIEWEPDFWTLHCDFHEARDRLKDKLFEIRESLHADEVHVALSDRENFRKDVLPTYKAHRAKVRKPVCLAPLREFLTEIGVVWQFPRLEGDDVLGILATHPTLIAAEERIIVSIDKDMKGVPGRLIRDGEEFVEYVSAADADFWHMVQTIAGDATDGYTGCPGVGVQTAEKVLREGRVLEPREHTVTRGPRKGEIEVKWEPGREGTLWEIAVSVYASKGFSEEMALQQARVARILRAENYDIDTEEIRLWTPSPA